MRPTVETLDSRDMPAPLILLDFSPDLGQAAPFIRSFQGLYSPWLDSNRDGRLTVHDAALAARTIYRQVDAAFRPFGYTVGYGDLYRDTGLGTRVGRAARANPHRDVYVVYVGGRYLPDERVLGLAYQALEGTNTEMPAYVYSGSVARNEYLPFVRTVSKAVCHEVGHQLGLGHPVRTTDYGDLMNAYIGYGAATFSRQPKRVELETFDGPRIGWQNAAQELRDSLTQDTF